MYPGTIESKRPTMYPAVYQTFSSLPSAVFVRRITTCRSSLVSHSSRTLHPLPHRVHPCTSRNELIKQSDEGYVTVRMYVHTDTWRSGTIPSHRFTVTKDTQRTGSTTEIENTYHCVERYMRYTWEFGPMND